MFPGIVRIFAKMTVLAMVMVICFACAKKSYIDVDYHLPIAEGSLAGRTVFMETQDDRSDMEIFDQRAKAEFQHFTGLFALSLQLSDGQQKVLGAYELPKLFETALAQRLDRMGVKMAAQQTPGLPVFQIKIDRFKIKLVGRKWMADIRYEASLTRDGQLIAREVVSGSAERLKVMGSGGAEKVIGEIFTEMINRLNIERLFQQANL